MGSAGETSIGGGVETVRGEGTDAQPPLTAHGLLADMLGRGAVPTIFVLGLVPLMQVRLLGSELGLHNIFNSPDSSVLSTAPRRFKWVV